MMLLLEKIVIDGFITKNQKLEFTFANNNVTVIYGINGSGKTTFLEILYAIFAQDEKILKKNNVSKIEIDYCSDKNRRDIVETEIKKTEDESEKDRLYDEKLSLNKNITIELDYKNYHWNDKNGSELQNKTALFLGIGRGIHKKDKIIEKQVLWKFFENDSDVKNFKKNLQYITYPTGFDKDFENLLNNLSDNLDSYLNHTDEKDRNKKERYFAQKIDKEQSNYLPNIEIDAIEAFLLNKYDDTVKQTQKKMQDSLFNSIAIASSRNQDILNDEHLTFQNLKENEKLILEALNGDNKDEFKAQIQNIVDNDVEYFKQQDNLIKIVIFNILKKLGDETVIYNRLKLLEKEFNLFLELNKNNKKLIFNSNGINIELEDKTTHSLERLSSGERHLLTFLATILLLGEQKDFILIDEPEISLDSEWQEKLLSVISKLAPNSQIIVASHSSTIWGEYFDETIEIVPIKIQ